MFRLGLTRAQRWIVLAHFGLALVYGFFTPPWEAHDETGHYAYVREVLRTRALPNALGAEKALFDQSHQPPLYYLLAAALTAWTPEDDAQPQPNPFAFDGTNRRGVRLMLRQQGEAFPWRGTFLALHATRVVSALLTAATVWSVGAAANGLFGSGSVAALLATALAAFNPQVLFMGAMVNNDAMVALVGALVLGVVVRLTIQPAQRRWALALGVGVGLGLLTKNNAFALVGFATLALLLVGWWQQWHWRALALRLALMLGAAGLTSAPWFVTNWLRYGRLLVDRNPSNPIILAPTSVIGEGVATSIRDAWLPQLFANTFRTFWGKFGWGNVGFPDWSYDLLAVMSVVGVLGCMWGAARADRGLRVRLMLLVLLCASVMVLPLYRALFFQDPGLMPGRYLMPALGGFVGLLGFGLSQVLVGAAEMINRRAQRLGQPWRLLNAWRVAVGFVRLLALGALLMPAVWVWPRYAPRFVQRAAATPLLTFGDVVQVLETEAHTLFLPDREGMRHYARVRVVWRPLRPVNEPLAFAVSVLGREQEVLGTLTTYPSGGNYPASNWQGGEAFEDVYDVLLEKPCARLPAEGRVHLSVITLDRGADGLQVRAQSSLPAYDPQGRAVTPILGRFRIGTSPPMAIFWQPPLATFEGIWLRDVSVDRDAERVLRVWLTYEMVYPSGKRGTAFVHALDAEGNVVAQDDHEPLNGDYPTDLWQPGECVRELFVLNLPNKVRGALRLVTGFYDPSGARFRTGTPDDLVHIGDVKMVP
ncbi:MAG: glycosyltransferase family 39 protein [Thermoflexales bacterium]|nr:glycosyltransferase family 39 protein [Thermoflexales bacterium]MCS7325399.1 glycosyltransferase family 39 protein [Thermoflexales bacterium]MCX7938339.1 glycosyltransferase family 39 protein [Thermoflexales bacterium]